MNTFGRYSLSYTPGTSFNSEYIEPTVNMEISAEASLSDMLKLFESFLQATGYVLDGKSLFLDYPETENNSRESSDQSFWFDDGFSLTGNYKDSQANDQLFSLTLPYSVTPSDHLSFRSNFGNDVITFG